MIGITGLLSVHVKYASLGQPHSGNMGKQFSLPTKGRGVQCTLALGTGPRQCLSRVASFWEAEVSMVTLAGLMLFWPGKGIRLMVASFSEE